MKLSPRKLSPRDRRALLLLVPAAGLFLLLNRVVLPLADSAGLSQSVAGREKILRKSQAIAAAVPSHEVTAGTLAATLGDAEKGLLAGPTPALQGAEVQQMVRDLAGAQGISLRSVDFTALKSLGPDYAQVGVSTTFTASMDQLVPFLNALGTAPKILSVDRLRLAASNLAATPTVPAKKLVTVYIAISGVARATPK